MSERTVLETVLRHQCSKELLDCSRARRVPEKSQRRALTRAVSSIRSKYRSSQILGVNVHRQGCAHRSGCSVQEFTASDACKACSSSRYRSRYLVAAGSESAFRIKIPVRINSRRY